GELSYFYLTKKQLKDLFDLQGRFDKEFLEILRQSDDSEPKPYLFQRIIMPIEHLIQASQKKEWETNGNLWLFFEDEEDSEKIQSILQIVPPDWPGRHQITRLLKALEENQKNDK
ncbi:MAG: hypothetical protein ACFFC7_16540, partial [Candidatus Hermodarchaeota archaeon]